MSRTTCWFQNSAHELTSGDRPRPAVQHACEGLAAADVLIVARVSGLALLIRRAAPSKGVELLV